MKVTSKYFQKEFDLSKAELVGEGNFAQVNYNTLRFIVFMILKLMILLPLEKLTKIKEKVMILKKRELSMKNLGKFKTKISLKFMTLSKPQHLFGISLNFVKAAHCGML